MAGANYASPSTHNTRTTNERKSTVVTVRPDGWQAGGRDEPGRRTAGNRTAATDDGKRRLPARQEAGPPAMKGDEGAGSGPRRDGRGVGPKRT